MKAFTKNPRVSIVLPTYNHLDYLPIAVTSLLEQTFTDFELIIVNDGSTDGTDEYLATLTDPRIRIINQLNQRLPSALNNGFTISRGELLTWTSADNYCAPHFLEALTRALESDLSVGFAVGAFAYVDTNGQILNFATNQDLGLPSLLTQNPGIAAFMYRRTCLDKVGRYDAKLEGAEDWDMWIRISEHYSAVYVEEILYYYRIHSETMTYKISDKVFTSSKQVFINALSRRNNSISINDLYPLWANRSM